MFHNYSAEELKWRGRSDARVLAEAEEIKADKARMAIAQKEAKKLLEEEQGRLKGIAKVANRNVSTTANKGRDTKRSTFEPYGGFPTTPIF